MMAANVIDKSELPYFDEETGLLPKDEDDSGTWQLATSTLHVWLILVWVIGESLLTLKYLF